MHVLVCVYRYLCWAVVVGYRVARLSYAEFKSNKAQEGPSQGALESTNHEAVVSAAQFVETDPEMIEMAALDSKEEPAPPLPASMAQRVSSRVPHAKVLVRPKSRKNSVRLDPDALPDSYYA